MNYNAEGGNIDEVLKNNKELFSLGFDDNQLTDYSLLAELEGLQSLEIRGFTYLDHAALASLENLVDLSINYNYDRREYNKSIGDISFLQNMQSLEYLYLNCVQNAEDLVYIQNLPNLTTLYLYNCKATDNRDAMAMLTAALPKCSIYY